MPETINWPKLTSPQRRSRRGLFFLIAIVAVLLLGSRTALSYWVDLLWFKSLGYGDVFWKARGLEWGIFAAFFALTFLILLGTFSALKHAHAGRFAQRSHPYHRRPGGESVAQARAAHRFHRRLAGYRASSPAARWPRSGKRWRSGGMRRAADSPWPTRSLQGRSTSICSLCRHGNSSWAGC